MKTDNPALRGRLWVFAGLVAIVLAGVALLPGAEPESDPSIIATLPEPVIATFPTQPEVAAGVLTNRTIPMSLVSGLTEYPKLVGPVEFAERYWIIGGSTAPTERVNVLSSIDGEDWNVVTEIAAPNGRALRVDQLGNINGQLVAAGSIGLPPLKPFWPSFPGDLTVWQSMNGESWTAERLRPDTTTTEFYVDDIVGTGSTALLAGYSRNPTPDPAILDLIPPELEPDLSEGLLDLWLTEDGFVIEAAPGIPVASEGSTSSAFMASELEVFFFRNMGSGWEAIDPPGQAADGFSLDIAVLPGGQLVMPGPGSPLVSASGSDWGFDDSLPQSQEYMNWSGHFAARRNLMSYWIDEGDQFARVDFPGEMLDSQQYVILEGTPAGLVATGVGRAPTFEEEATQWGNYTVSYGTQGLTVSGSSLAEPVTIEIGREVRPYDALTNAVIFQVESHDFAIPLTTLQRLGEWPRQLYRVYVSIDGVSWSTSENLFFSHTIQTLGGGPDFFLVQTTDYRPTGQAVPVVYRADLSP